MSVARNLWRVADAPHIVPADSVERQTVQWLINACPAGLFRSHQKVTYVLTIAVAQVWHLPFAVRRKTLQQWRYPPSGFGITYRFG